MDTLSMCQALLYVHAAGLVSMALFAFIYRKPIMIAVRMAKSMLNTRSSIPASSGCMNIINHQRDDSEYIEDSEEEEELPPPPPSDYRNETTVTTRSKLKFT